MQIKITQSFRHESSPRPFVQNELVNVPDDLGQQWIEEGKATPFAAAARPVVNAVPPRRQRERATRIS
jgi:hypothetical protein